MIRKRVLKKIFKIFLMLFTIICLILGLTVVFFKIREKTQKTQIEKYHAICYGNKYIGNLCLQGMNKEQIIYILENEISEIKNRVVKVKWNDQEIVNTIDTFNPTIKVLINGNPTEYTNDQIADFLIKTDKEKTIGKQLEVIKNGKLGSKIIITFDYSLNGEIVQEYVSNLAQNCFVAPVEANISLADNDQFEVTESVDGQKINESMLVDAIQNTSDKNDWKSVVNIEGKMDIIKPHYNSNDLKKVNTLISSFQTHFIAASSRGRNIIKGTSRINGTVLMPGDEFSVDQVILPRTIENGYLIGKAFLNGRVVDSVGGGVCQIATTMYNTILRAGIIPDVRKAHSMSVSYVPLGLDAAVTTGSKDLMFTNTLSYPIYIEAENNGNSLIYKIYSGENALEGYTYEPRSVRHSSFSATAYLDVYKDGSLIKSIFLHKDRYLSKKG
ncbi:VanW family protein [Anaerosacchariphilus polymeriproducens]|nr:VanW family protein [Anaerosacchariphilus polymeriproducens]